MSDFMDPLNSLTPTRGQRIGTFFSDVGLGSPVTRVLVGFGFGTLLTFLLQANFAFDAEGIRPLKFLEPDNPRATLMPWYGPGVVMALLFGVFF